MKIKDLAKFNPEAEIIIVTIDGTPIDKFTKLNQERYNIFSVVYELVLLIKYIIFLDFQYNSILFLHLLDL